MKIHFRRCVAKRLQFSNITFDKRNGVFNRIQRRVHHNNNNTKNEKKKKRKKRRTAVAYRRRMRDNFLKRGIKLEI